VVKEILILVGNIASGKSTYCKELAKDGYVILSCDSLRYMIGANTYTFDISKEPILAQTILTMYKLFQELGYNIVIDETNMSQIRRAPFIANKLHGYKIKAIVFPPRTIDDSVKSRLLNNHGDTPACVWAEVWKRKKEQFQYPSYEEGFDDVIYRR
jgi:predicted kinase